MNELTSKTPVKPIGATAKDSSALRGLCASLNSGFTAPGGASEATQKEIQQAMKSPVVLPEGMEPTAGPPMAELAAPEPQNERPARPSEEATHMPTSLPTAEERAKTMVHREVEEAPVVTKTDEDCCDATVNLSDCARPEPDPNPTDEGTANDKTVNPKYRKVLFTGQMKAGKDYAAVAAGYTIMSLASPLYALLNFFFGITETQKDLPGARKFMQDVGTWGRGDVSKTAPLTPERAIFTRMIEVMAGAGVLPMSDCVDWERFGKHQNIWLDACLKNADQILEADPSAKVAVVNGRFENEIKAFDDAGWARFHVMASPLALKQRREADGVNATALQHDSERLAVMLDKGSVAVANKSQKPKINVIWNDPKAGRPSTKFYTVTEFAKTANSAE